MAIKNPASKTSSLKRKRKAQRRGRSVGVPESVTIAERSVNTISISTVMANSDFGIVCTDDSSIPVHSKVQSGHLSSVDPLCVDSVKIETHSRLGSERIFGNTNADRDCVEMSESQSDHQSILSPLIASPILVPRDSSNQYVIDECDPLQLVGIKESVERFQRDITGQPSETAWRPFSPQSSNSDHSLSRTLMVNEESLCDPLLQMADIGNVQNNRLEILEASNTAEFHPETSEAEERPRVPPQMTNRSPVLPAPTVNEISGISSCVQDSDIAPLVCQSDASSRSQSSARKHMCLKCHVLIPEADLIEHAQFHNISTSLRISQTHGTVTSVGDILSCIECSFKAANTAELCEHLKLHKIQESVHSGKVPPPTHTSRLSNIASPSLSHVSVASTIANVPLVITLDDNDDMSDSRSSELVVQNNSNSLRLFQTPSCALTSSTPDIPIIVSLQIDTNLNQRYFNPAPTSRLPQQQSITSLLANLLTDSRGGSIPAAAPMPLSSFQSIDSSIKQSSQFTGGRCSTVTTNTVNSPVVASLEIAPNEKQPTLYLMSQSKDAPQQQREDFSFSTLLRDMSQTAGSNITTVPQPHRLPSYQPAGHSINSPSKIGDSLRTVIHQSDIVQPTDDQSSTKNTRTSVPPSGFLGGQPNLLPPSTRVPVNVGPPMALSHTLPLYRSTESSRSRSFLVDSSEESPVLHHRNSLPIPTSSTLLSPSRETSVIHPPISSTMRVLLDPESQSRHQPNLSTDNQTLAQSQPPKANQSPLLIMTPANQTQGTGTGHTCGSSSIIQSHQLSHCSTCVELSANQEKSSDSNLVRFVPADEVQRSGPLKHSQTSIGTDRPQLSFLSRIDHLINANTTVLQSLQTARKNNPSTLSSPSTIYKNMLATPAASHERSLLRNTDPNPIPSSSVSFNLDLADGSINQNSSTFHCANSAAPPARKNIDVAPARAYSSNNLAKYGRTRNEMNTAVLENSDDPDDPDPIRRTYDLRNVASSRRKQNSLPKSHDSSSESESSATADPDYVPPSFHHSDDDSDNPNQDNMSRFVNSNAVPNVPLSTNSSVSASVTTYPKPTKNISQVTVGARSAANIVAKVAHLATNPTQRILREANPTASNFLSTSCGITNPVSNISMIQSLPTTPILESCSIATNIIPITVQNTDPKNSTHVATSSGIAKIIASVSVSTSPIETFSEAHSRLTNSISRISHSAILMSCPKPAEVIPQVTVGEYPAASSLEKRVSVSTNLIQSTLQDTNSTAGAPLVPCPGSMNPITATTTLYSPPTSTHLATCSGIPEIIPFFSRNMSSVDSLSAQTHFSLRNSISSTSQERNPTASASLAVHPGSPNLVPSISGGQSSDASDRCKHLNPVPNTFQAMSSASNTSEEHLASRDPTPTTCHKENSTIAKSPLIAKSSENIQVNVSSAKSLRLDRVASDYLLVQQPGKSEDGSGKPSASSNVVLDISSSDDSVESGDCDSDDPEIVLLDSNTSATGQRERTSSMNSSDSSSYEAGYSVFVDPDYVPPSREKLPLKTPNSVIEAIPSYDSWLRNSFVKDDSVPESSRPDHDCYLCSRKFDSPELLKEHRDKRCTELRCCKCFFRAASEKALKAHENKHARLRPYQCDECDQSFAKRSAYISHFLVHRNDFCYKCNVCGQGFNTYTPYEGHVNKHINRRPYKCLKCTHTFTCIKSLRNHRKRIHKRNALRQCSLCQKFISKVWLANHMKRHEKRAVQSFLCDQCGRSFKSKPSLSRHNLLHTGERPHMCNYCGATFKVASALKQHERKHTGERPYKCDVCGKTFAYNTPYVYHLRTHTGERPYKCEFCDMTFAQPSPYAVHRRLHTGERPYKCKICPEAFPSHAAVRNHMQTHANAAKEGTSKRRTRRTKAQIENEEDAELGAPKPKNRRTGRAKAVVDDSSSDSEDSSEVVPTQSSRRSGRQTKCTRSLAEEDEDTS